MQIEPFQPFNNTTVNLAVSTSTGNVALPARSTNGENVRLHNAGSATVFISFGTSSAATAATATGMPLPSGAVEIFSCSPTVTHIAAITASGSATLYATLGHGV